MKKLHVITKTTIIFIEDIEILHFGLMIFLTILFNIEQNDYIKVMMIPLKLNLTKRVVQHVVQNFSGKSLFMWNILLLILCVFFMITVFSKDLILRLDLFPKRTDT